MLANYRLAKSEIVIALLLFSAAFVWAAAGVPAAGVPAAAPIGRVAPESLPGGSATENASVIDPLDQQDFPEEAATLPSPRSRRSTLNLVDVDRFVRRLESDRRLLSEIRKEVPEARLEAEMYLKRLKDLAARSDPVRLVPLVNRVMEQAPIYFDWMDREYENEEERAMEYYVGGARGFNYALESFKNAVMMTVINRLDIAARVIKELDADSIQ
ncbi:MAG: hypothetical protein CMN78_02195 [Spirochaetales bacterium]|nr:hypothetical protein [Spirochaetales bacterium]MAG13386.1 hypothetical protein [Spirochaetales bacterium]